MPAGGYKKHDDHSNDARVQEAAKFAVEKASSPFQLYSVLALLVSCHNLCKSEILSAFIIGIWPLR